MKKKTTEEFIQKSKEVHGDRYDYSLVEYVGSNKKVKIICKKHGVFKQTPEHHSSRGCGCPDCSKWIEPNLMTQYFIERSKKVHGDKYDYSKVEYINRVIGVKIICAVHGDFIQSPYVHLKGHGCIDCGNEYSINGVKNTTKKLNTEIFINKSKKVHGDKYDYSLVEYKGGKIKVKIMCPYHDTFKQMAYSHLQGIGCPHCNESKGEKEIKNLLNNNLINYITQKKFKECKNIKELPFDFYLPKYNTCIEYDGEQHYILSNFFGGEDGLTQIQKRDKIKDEYCLKNNIHLLRIRYDENIEKKLNEFLLSHDEKRI